MCVSGGLVVGLVIQRVSANRQRSMAEAIIMYNVDDDDTAASNPLLASSFLKEEEGDFY